MEKKDRAHELRQICSEMMHILRTYQISIMSDSSLAQFRNGYVDFNELSIATDNMNRVRLSLEKVLLFFEIKKIEFFCDQNFFNSLSREQSV